MDEFEKKIVCLISSVAQNLDKELTWTLVELIREVQCPRCVGMGYVTTEKDKNCEMCLGTGEKYYKLLANLDLDIGVKMAVDTTEKMIKDLKKALGLPQQKVKYRRGMK